MSTIGGDISGCNLRLCLITKIQGKGMLGKWDDVSGSTDYLTPFG